MRTHTIITVIGIPVWLAFCSAISYMPVPDKTCCGFIASPWYPMVYNGCQRLAMNWTSVVKK